DCEFFASTDTCCRPVCLTLGPDGAIYVLDFYREVIETPLSLNEEMKRTLPLQSAGKGRIWRIVPEGKRPATRLPFAQDKAEQLMAHLDNPNYWWRITAQRLLVERKRDVVESVKTLPLAVKEPFGRIHALAAMQ